jgi:hypothetical protein
LLLGCLQPDAHYSKSVKNNTVDGRNVSNGGCIPPPHFRPRLPCDAKIEHAQRHRFSLHASSLSLSLSRLPVRLLHVPPLPPTCSSGQWMKLQHLVVLGEAASPPVAVVTGEAVAASHGEEQLTGPRYPPPELLPSPATGPPSRHFPHAGEAGGRIPTSVAGPGRNRPMRMCSKWRQGGSGSDRRGGGKQAW